MGRLKALLPWRGTTLIEYALRELGGARVDARLVVVGHAADELGPIVAATGAQAILNPRYREGRATSIAAGVAALPAGTEHVLVVSVDQPRPRAVVDALIAAHLAAGATISRAVHRGRHGHPTIFAGCLLGELARV